VAINPPAFRTTDDKFQVPIFSAQMRSLNNGRQPFEAPCNFSVPVLRVGFGRMVRALHPHALGSIFILKVDDKIVLFVG
jgi:hypothetical protein